MKRYLVDMGCNLHYLLITPLQAELNKRKSHEPLIQAAQGCMLEEAGYDYEITNGKIPGPVFFICHGIGGWLLIGGLTAWAGIR